MTQAQLPRARTKAATVGLVLAGGGARGAYEVGVLDWVATQHPGWLDAVRVVTGASVGAVNAAFLASRGLTPAAVRELVGVWQGLELRNVLRLELGHVAVALRAAYRQFFGGRPPRAALLQHRGLDRLIADSIQWDGLARHVDEGRFDGVAITATDIATGRSHVFVDRPDHRSPPHWANDASLVAVPTRLRPEHVRASCSLPFLFEPVRIDRRWYTDGSLRHNTPLSPAMRLGAERLVVVANGRDQQEEPIPDVFPGLSQLLGKLFNSLFLDRTRFDLDRLERINDILESGTDTFGCDFVPRLQRQLMRRGRRPYRYVRYVDIRPSADIGLIAGRVLETPATLRAPLRGLFRWMMRPGQDDDMRGADAASYLLFDGGYADELMALGRQDAALHEGALEALFVGGSGADPALAQPASRPLESASRVP